MHGRPARKPDPGRITDEKLLVSAERVARTGSFELDLGTGECEFSFGLRRIFGAAERQLTREGLLDRVHPDDCELIDAAIRAAEMEGTGFDLQVRILRFDDMQRAIRARGSVLVDWLGTRRLVGTVQDVTARSAGRAVAT